MPFCRFACCAFPHFTAFCAGRSFVPMASSDVLWRYLTAPFRLAQILCKNARDEGGGVIFSGDLFFLGVVRAVGVRVWRFCFCFCFCLGMVQALKTRHRAGCLVWAVVVFWFIGSWRRFLFLNWRRWFSGLRMLRRLLVGLMGFRGWRW